MVTVIRNEIKPPLPSIAGQMPEFIQGITDPMIMIINLDGLLSDPRIIIHEEV